MNSHQAEDLLRAVISAALPHLSVEDIQPLPSTRLQRLHGIRTSDGKPLVLAVPPPPMVRLLRFEQLSTNSEAILLRWLRESVPMGGSGTQGETSSPGSTAADPGSRALVVPEMERRHSYLGRLVPALVAQASVTSDLGVEYSIFEPTIGAPVVLTQPPLINSERRAVDFQTGRLCRAVSEITSPSGKFGMALAVLSSLSPSKTRTPLSYIQAKAMDSWSEAFHLLLENILRDGEDMTVMLGYGPVRRHFTRFRHLLDGVTVPRLVVVDAWDDANIMVHRSTHESDKSQSSKSRSQTQKKDKYSSRSGGKSADRSSREKSKDKSKDRDKEKEKEKSKGKFTEELSYQRAPSSPPKSSPLRIEVTGLREWSNCVFGDPLFAAAFSQNPTGEFLRGFHTRREGERDGDSDGSDGPPMIEDPANADIRMLLYECYHAIVGVVREFYRPQPDAGKLELAARKRLNVALAKLAEIGDEGKPRRRRPSGETSPAKRPKPDEGSSKKA